MKDRRVTSQWLDDLEKWLKTATNEDGEDSSTFYFPPTGDNNGHCNNQDRAFQWLGSRTGLGDLLDVDDWYTTTSLQGLVETARKRFAKQESTCESEAVNCY